MRVVSLLPSSTEILYAVGVEPVAVSHECDYPPAALDLPVANRSRIDPDASTAEINAQVSAAERTHDGVYELFDDVLETADPDLIVTQGVCDVCAVDDRLVQATVDRLGINADILSTHPHSLEEVLEDIRRVGRAVDRVDTAQDVVGELSNRIQDISNRAPADDRRIGVFDWTDPVMTAGHWVPGMIDRLGGSYGLAAPGDRSEPVPWETVCDYDPEVLIVAPCGFPLEKSVAAVSDFRRRAGWEDLTAVQTRDVYAMDGHHYLNRPGPRLVDTLEIIAWMLHPDGFEQPPSSVVRQIATSPA